MKTISHSAILFLIMVLFSPKLTAETIIGYSQIYLFNTKYKITGLITDSHTGLPIEGATVNAINYSSLPSTNDGVYRLLVPSGLGYFIEFSAPGYVPHQVSNIAVSVENPEVTIDVHLDHLYNYLDYRVVPLPLVPNPPILEVQEGATGYVWFLLEGKVAEQLWVPVPSSTIEVIDTQGNHVYDKDGQPIMTNRLSYKFLNTSFNIQHAGIFGVPVDYDIIQDGTAGSQEVFTVVAANGQPISPENRQSFEAKVVPFKYTQSWGFRYYGKVGAGAGTLATGGIAKSNSFIGGGSGATLQLQLEGLSNNPNWSLFQVHRKDDLFAGAQISIGPPSLLITNTGAGAGSKNSFSYQKEYEFNMNEMAPLEAPMAFYLFYEPGIIYSPKTIGLQISVFFLKILVHHLINNSDYYELNVARVADEAGIDLSASGSLSVGIGFEALESLNLTMGPSLGVHGHFGGTTRKTADNYRYNKLYAGGGYKAGVEFGLKTLNTSSLKTEFFYPSMLKNKTLPSRLDVEFISTSKFYNHSWKSTKLEASLESNSSFLNIYNLPGTTQKYTAWVDFDSAVLKNLFTGNSPVLSEAMEIGQSSVNINIDDNTFNQNIFNFLESVYNVQNNNHVILDYGYHATDKSGLEADLTLQFPIPKFPILDIVVGGGFEYTHELNYDLAKGQWAKGLPFLQNEMSDPPKPNISFEMVLNQLWQKFLEDPFVDGLVSALTDFFNMISFNWANKDGSSQVITLNEIGSQIEIREHSIPLHVDSVLCLQWDWAEEPSSKIRDAEKISAYKNYVKNLRAIREEVVGMKYGVGGFYRFDPLWEAFGDSTYLTIAYTNDEVLGIDATSLGMYWEDTLGIWRPLESFIEPELKKVSAWISHFTTYTLAPRMPQGNYGFQFVPDSIHADAASIAVVTSDLLFNNDSTLIDDGTLFTIELNRGSILSEDADETLEGIQIAVQDGVIEFEVLSGSIALPINLSATSINGFASCEGILIQYDTIPPTPPHNLIASAGNSLVFLEWSEANEPDIAGYKIYYDTDTIPPFNGIHTVFGHPSPIILGNETSRNVIGLMNDTTYYFAVSAFDISGNESEFSYFVSATPNCFAPEPERLEVTVLGTDIVLVNWNADNAQVTWDVIWGPEGFDPENNGSIVSGIGNKSHLLSGLLPGTSYSVFVRSVCSENNYSDWEGPVTFTTLGCLAPYNLYVSDRTSSSVALGWMSPDGIYNWNIKWGAAGFDPDLEGNLISTSDKSYILEGIEQSVHYEFYVQSMCDEGVYSTWVGPLSFVTNPQTQSCGSITDVDDNLYSTVVIGDQCWMRENLGVTRYADGSPILTNLGNDDWISTEYGAYSIFPYTHWQAHGINSDEEMVEAYGILYNWHAVNDTRGLCPPGWHVPSDDEWTQLTNTITGGISHGGLQLRSCRQVNSPLGDDCNISTHPRWDEFNCCDQLSYWTDMDYENNQKEIEFFSLGNLCAFEQIEVIIAGGTINSIVLYVDNYWESITLPPGTVSFTYDGSSNNGNSFSYFDISLLIDGAGDIEDITATFNAILVDDEVCTIDYEWWWKSNISSDNEKHTESVSDCNNSTFKDNENQPIIPFGTDDYNFSALPAGFRSSFNGAFFSIGSFTRWWTSDYNDESRAWYRGVDYNSSDIYRWHFSMNNGYSVRCLREAPFEACLSPINLEFTSISASSSQISWSPGSSEESWDLKYGLQGFVPENDGELITSITVSWFEISDLNPGTVYDVYLRSVCSETKRSNWVGPVSFTTLSDTGQHLSLVNETITTGEEVCFDALQTITVSNFTVEAGGSATLIAGESIHLLPGTTVEHGGYLLARIATHEDDYCGIPRATEIAKEPVTSKEEDVVSTDFNFEIRENGFFKLYPNPTDGTFTLELTTAELEQGITVEVHSVLGGQLFTKELPPQRLHTLSLESQQPGMYIIRVMKGDQIGVERLIKR